MCGKNKALCYNIRALESIKSIKEREMENNFQDQNTNQNNYQNGGTNYTQYTRPISRREIGLCILFSLITCGIYGIYWMIVLNDDVNEIVGDRNATSGGMVFLFSLLTCGIYGVYWIYCMGEKLDRFNDRDGESGLRYVLLSIFCLSIVAYSIMQDQVNKHATIA